MVKNTGKSTKNSRQAKTQRKGRGGKAGPQMIAEVLGDIALGFCVKDACKKAGIHPATWYKWMLKDDGLGERYARAKTLMAEAMAEEILQIADNESGDLLQGKDGPYGNRAAVDRSRLRVDSRKWLLSKLMPKKYGDRVDHTAENGAFNVTLHFDREDENA